MRVAIYARVSTEDQARTGYSLQSQVDACEKNTDSVSTIEKFIDDGFSGEFLDRPAMTRLREGIKHKLYDVVICYDPDRLARNLAHQLIITDEIEKSGATLKFVSVTFEQSPEGRLFYSIRGAVSAFEKEKIKERTNRGKKVKMMSGKMPNKYKTYGYDWDDEKCNYKINEEQATVVKLIFDLLTKDKLGIKKIADQLTEMGISAPRGSLWEKSSLYCLLTRSDYCGKHIGLKYKHTNIGIGKRMREKRDSSEVVEVETPAIISVETFEKAQNQLQVNKNNSKRNTQRYYLLQGVIFCKKCGNRMYGAINHYRCSSGFKSGGSCNCRFVKVSNIDNIIWNKLKELSQDKVKLEKALLPKEEIDNNAKVDKQIERLNNQRKTVLSWSKKQLISEEEAEDQLVTIKAKIESLKLQPKKKNTNHINVNEIIDEINNADTPDKIKKAVAATIKKVYVLRTDNIRYGKEVLSIDIEFI